MAKIKVTDKDYNFNNIDYIDASLFETFTKTDCKVCKNQYGSRAVIEIDCPEYYYDIYKKEVDDKVADVITVSYKYEFFKTKVKPQGLNQDERELLLTSLIAADLEEDKRYVSAKIKDLSEVAIDGIYNFRLKLLKKKWEEVVTYIPPVFINEQLKDFIVYLLEGRNRKVYVDGDRVYDARYKRLMRSDLIISDENLKIIKEVLLSGCGEVELNGKPPENDEFYLKEYYGGKVVFNKGYYC